MVLAMPFLCWAYLFYDVANGACGRPIVRLWDALSGSVCLRLETELRLSTGRFENAMF